MKSHDENKSSRCIIYEDENNFGQCHKTDVNKVDVNKVSKDSL